MKLVIIAAGLGSRLSPVSSGTPKLLLPILGQRLIDKILANCIEADIKNIVVVTGYNNHIIEDHLKTIQTSIKIETAYNPDWELANGVSVLAAQNLIPVGEDFMISMSDHYYNSDLLKTIKTHADDQTVASVGADYNISEIHDIDDGMKLKIDKESNLIRAMSKNLFEYDAIDCGIFKCRYTFFDYLNKAKSKNECSLSDACNILINENLMGSVDIKSCPWIDIDTPEALSFIKENPKKFSISTFSGNIKFGSFGEYEIRLIKIKIPNIETNIPIISINLLIMKINSVFAIFFISIIDESNLPLCII